MDATALGLKLQFVSPKGWGWDHENFYVYESVEPGDHDSCGTLTMKSGTAIIIGAGPAGLTAALELQRRSNIKPIVIEAATQVGGMSRTVRYKGNRMDIGGHRFFSKSDRVMQWWLELMPVEAAEATDGELRYQGQQRDVPSRQPDCTIHRTKTW